MGTCPSAWPKVYYSDGSPYITKGNNGNAFTTISPNGQLNQNYNHIGAIPSVTNLNNAYTFHYSGNGFTNYYKEGNYPSLFITSSGVVQSLSYVNNNPTFNYYDENSGNVVANPPLVPFNEKILCETNNGGYITVDNNNFMHYHNVAINFSTNISIPYGIGYFKFNKNTNRIFLQDGLGSLRIYDLNLLTNTFYAGPSSPNGMFFWYVTIDNYDRIFVNKYDLVNGLKIYDISANTFTPALINGLPLYTSFLMYDNSPYTSNEFLTNDEASNKIYYVNVSSINTPIVKHLDKSGSFSVETYRYMIDNSTIFISNNFYSAITIGNQTIQQLPNLDLMQIFITKFNLSDFQSFQAYSNLVKTESKESLKLSISPNPITNNNLNLSIFENDKLSLNSYTVMVTNKMGRVLLQKNSHFSGSGIDIRKLEMGVYFVTVINKKNEKVTAMFSKL